MTLAAQRFADNATLTRCVEQGYRMFRGEQDVEAVKRLQLALFDLGYPDIDRVDGVWGNHTDAAVVAYKTDENLHPTDPVASRGTIGQLDAFFSWESDAPDSPDPSAVGLVELAEETAAAAASYADQAAAILETLAWGAPAASPDEDPVRSALLAHVGLDAAGPDAPDRGAELMTLLSALSVALDPMTADFTYEAMDHAAWDEQGFSFYWAYRHLPPRLVVTPGFRNALTDNDRLATLLRLAARKVDPDMTALAYPGTARYGALTEPERGRNPAGLAALVLFVAAGITEGNRPPPTWGDLSSLPF